MEQRNSGNTVLFYGKDGDLTGPDREHNEISMLALHLLQSRAGARQHSTAATGTGRTGVGRDLGDADRRGLTPLFWSNINPYGRFRPDMDRRLALDTHVKEA